jgi:hypothetical protein
MLLTWGRGRMLRADFFQRIANSDVTDVNREVYRDVEITASNIDVRIRCRTPASNCEDEEDRKHDDTSDGIDWDEIIATTQDDFEAGRFSYNSADCATHHKDVKRCPTSR